MIERIVNKVFGITGLILSPFWSLFWLLGIVDSFANNNLSEFIMSLLLFILGVGIYIISLHWVRE